MQVFGLWNSARLSAWKVEEADELLLDDEVLCTVRSEEHWLLSSELGGGIDGGGILKIIGVKSSKVAKRNKVESSVKVEKKLSKS